MAHSIVVSMSDLLDVELQWAGLEIGADRLRGEIIAMKLEVAHDEATRNITCWGVKNIFPVGIKKFHVKDRSSY